MLNTSPLLAKRRGETKNKIGWEL